MNISDEQWREMGFGYRAKFFTATTKLLTQDDSPVDPVTLKPRDSKKSVAEGLQCLNGVGRKVADCIALFAVDEADTVPVDTHVFQMAVRWRPEIMTEIAQEKAKRELAAEERRKKKEEKRNANKESKSEKKEMAVEEVQSEQSDEKATPKKKKKGADTKIDGGKDKVTITEKVYKKVLSAFLDAFPGGYAGWAHSVLFVAELPSFDEKGKNKKKRKKVEDPKSDIKTE